MSLILFIIPLFLHDSLKFTLPTLFESIIFIFIFSAEIFGEINNFYGILPFWDSMLHVINGFLAAAIGFSLNKNSKGINLSPLYVTIVGFFSMAIDIFWEFLEFSTDKILKIDSGYLDIGLIDTTKDLFVNLIGAITFSILGYFYLITNKKESFITNFIPVSGKREIKKLEK